MTDNSLVVGREPCPSCGSSDALARYADGHGYCFSAGCGRLEPASSNRRGGDSSPPRTLLSGGSYRDIAGRGITEETARKFGYRYNTYQGQPVHVAEYRDSTAKVVAQHLRFPGKEFIWLGAPKKLQLFGQHLWRNGGKRVVITEGEIDCLTVSQLMGNSWPVVSLSSGGGAYKDVLQNLDWLESFDSVVLMFDQDDAGQEAVARCAPLFSPGKCKVAVLPRKDPNECLTQGLGDAILRAVWDARDWRPDGIVTGRDIPQSRLTDQATRGFDLPWSGVSGMLHGIRKGEITLVTAGSGIGKSTLVREMAYHLHQAHGLCVGNIFLEESLAKTAQGYAALHHDVALGLLRENPALLSVEQWEAARNAVLNERMLFYDHFGSLDTDNLLTRIRYMAVAGGADFVFLDHLSLVISGRASGKDGERKDIDILMTRLRSLVEETGVGLVAVVHLSQPEGKAHEEGGRVTLSQLRGSGALKQLADNVLAAERNQQGEASNTLSLRLLKNREFGELGVCDTLSYDPRTGRLAAEVPDSAVKAAF